MDSVRCLEELGMLVKNIKSLTSTLFSIQFRCVYQKVNFVANAIANLGHGVPSVAIWSYCLLIFFYPILDLNQLEGQGSYLYDIVL